MKKVVLLGDSIRMGYDKYNAEAIRVLSDTDTLINDLYPLTVSFPNEYRFLKKQGE